jgi:hypothetical protein
MQPYPGASIPQVRASLLRIGTYSQVTDGVYGLFIFCSPFCGAKLLIGGGGVAAVTGEPSLGAMQVPDLHCAVNDSVAFL